MKIIEHLLVIGLRLIRNRRTSRPQQLVLPLDERLEHSAKR